MQHRPCWQTLFWPFVEVLWVRLLSIYMLSSTAPSSEKGYVYVSSAIAAFQHQPIAADPLLGSEIHSIEVSWNNVN